MAAPVIRLSTLALLAVVAVFLAAVFPAARPALAQQERVLSFASDITVREDGSLRVVETLEVASTGDEIERGIFRDFPLRSLTELGLNHLVGFEIVAIERDGIPEPYFLEPLPAGVRIYIGQADTLLQPGRYRYTIAYDTSRQLLHRPGEDELYWNVTGDAWAFPIDRATATVRLPDGVAADRVAAYTGRRGARGGDTRAAERTDGTVRIATTRSLAPGEGLTIAVTWPEGAVSRPSETRRLLNLALDNKGVLIGAVLLVALLIYFLLAWHRVGRDPSRGVVFPRFEAPDGMSPVAVGYVWHGGFADGFEVGRALTVAITSLATKRRLVIDDDDGLFTLSARKGAPGKLPPGEEAVLHALFAGDEETVTFGSAYQPAMGRASKGLLDAFGWEYGRAYFQRNAKPWILGALIAAAAALSSLVIDAMGPDAWLLVPVMALFAGALLTIGTVLVSIVVTRWWTAATTGTAYRFIRSLGQLAGAAGAFLATALVGWIMADMVAPAALPIAALPVPVAVVFWYLMKAPTRLGRRTLDAIEGYRMYLSVAEADRLNSAGREPEVTEALFEAHLPYAMALDVEEQWSDKVMARLETSTDSRPGRRPYRPDWYRGAGRGLRGSLAGALSQNLGGAAAQAMTRPSESRGGTSSGGSSGGGGGGGGGGGW